MTMTIGQVVTQLQQEAIKLLKLLTKTGHADAERAINNLATAQVRKDTPSLDDVKGLGRQTEFSDKRWKKTEAFFASVIKESEMMLEW